MSKTRRIAVRLTALALFAISLLGSELPRFSVQAQSPSPLDAHVQDANSATWSSDGRYYVFQHTNLYNGLPTDKPSWVQYDTVTGQVTTSRSWPLQPSLTDAQKQAFQLSTDPTLESFAYLSPNSRYIAYDWQGPSAGSATAGGVPIGIADLQTGQHIVINLPTIGNRNSDFLWSGDSSTFTVRTITEYGAIYLFYITNLNQSLSNAKLLTISDAATPSQDIINGIPIGTNTVTPYGVHAISFDGQKLLLDGRQAILVWNRIDPSQNRVIGDIMTNEIGGIGFNDQDSSQIFMVTQNYIQKYDLATSQTVNLGNSLDPLTASTKSLIIRAWVAPDGKHVAIMTGAQNSDNAHIRVVALTS